MTTTNRFGDYVSWRDLRQWAIRGTKLWLPQYLADAERHHALTAPYCQLPVTWRPAPDVRKWPEEQLPAVIFGSPGLAGSPPVKQADRSYMTTWVLALSGVVHGSSEEDTELIASCYGIALRTLFLQQAGRFTDTAGYDGPMLAVESLTWEDEGYDDIAASRSRTLVAATVTFTVVFRNTATSLGGPDQPPIPPDPPSTDPGPFPEITEAGINQGDLIRESIA